MYCNQFGELSDDEICAVLQLTYQLISGANYGRISEADNPSIDIMIDKLGLSNNPLLEIVANAHWNDAMDMNPYTAFRIVTNFTHAKKLAFKDAILAVVRNQNTMLRMDIANQIFARTRIVE